MYVLIIAFITGTVGSQYPAFAMQEFSSLKSCEAAKVRAMKMAADMSNTGREVAQVACQPK